MFSVYVIGSRHHDDADMVKLTMVFYRSGYNRVYKVLSISGLYSDWDRKTKSFKPSSPENISKNKLLQKERIKYLNVAERWEYSGRNWSPGELAHHFDNEVSKPSRYMAVGQVLDEMIEDYLKRERIRNGRLFTGSQTARYYKHLKKSLEKFVLAKYRKQFSKLSFRDIDKDFIAAYTLHEQAKGSKAGNHGGVHRKLTSLYTVCSVAKNREIYNVNLSVFQSVSTKLRMRRFFSKAVPHETIIKIENMNRQELTKQERFYLDLFLFSYHAGGMSGIDICYMERSWIKGNTIEYERTKFDNRVRVILTNKAADLIEKYRSESYMNYVFPVFKKREQSMTSRYDRVRYITASVNATLKKVCESLGIPDKITWSTARSSFISKMLDDGFHVMQVAEQTGNSAQTISKHYYAITNRDEVREKMNRSFSSSEGSSAEMPE